MHCAGESYRLYIEATVLSIPISKLNEQYLDRYTRLKLPFGIVENKPIVDAAATLSPWAESIWLPSIFLTDSHVHWEPSDEYTSCLGVLYGDAEELFKASFDPYTG